MNLKRILDNIRSYFNILRGNTPQNAYDKLQYAVRNKARHQAEADYHHSLAIFYERQAQTTDHETDWWGFAHAKQKEADYLDDHLLEYNRTLEAGAKVTACEIRLTKLKGHNL